jgi:hypothetical protein
VVFDIRGDLWRPARHDPFSLSAKKAPRCLSRPPAATNPQIFIPRASRANALDLACVFDMMRGVA